MFRISWTRACWYCCLGVILWLAPPALAAEAHRYSVRAEESSFTIKVGRAGLFKVFGHDHLIQVRRFDGDVLWHPESIESSSVQLDIDATSLTVVDPGVKEEEKAEVQAEMETAVLEVESYPSIELESSEVKLEETKGENHRIKLTGWLTLHGVTHEIEVPLQLVVSEEKLQARGSTKLKGTDYGIQPVSIAGGTVKTKDDLELDFDLVATRR